LEHHTSKILQEAEREANFIQITAILSATHATKREQEIS